MRRLVILLMMLPAVLQADLDFEPVVASYLVRAESNQQMDAIANAFEVVGPMGQQGYEVYVPAHRQQEFLKLAPQAVLRLSDIRTELLDSLASFANVGDERYRSWEEVEADLIRLAESSEFVELQTYGRSKQGRKLYVLKVSDNVSQDEDEPELLLTSATHGDEIITVEVLWRLLNELVDGYGRNGRLTQMVDQHELYFALVVNPDGFSRRSRYSGGVDPNRSYPRVDGGQASKADCIENLIQFFHTRNFVGSMDFHAYGRLVMYPWGYSRSATDHETEFSALSRLMSESNGYRAGQISRILYTAPGSSADYYYWKKQTKAFGIEIADGKAPSPQEIPQVVEQAREMTWKFIESFN